MEIFLKALGVVLIAMVKLLFSPVAAMASGFGFWESVALIATGGILGVTVFFWLSEYLANKFKSKEGKKKFTRINKFIIRMKHKVGMKGIAFIGLPFLSVPISCAIMAKFHRHEPLKAYLYLSISVLFWSFFLSSISYFF